MTDYPNTDGGQYIVGKHPIHTQVVVSSPDNPGEPVYIPVKGFTWDKATDIQPNLHSGSPLPSSLVDGHHNYKFTFDIGTWLTTPSAAEIGKEWEWLAYSMFVRPLDAGRPMVFNVIHKQSAYFSDGENNLGKGASKVGGETIMQFEGCKITRQAYSQGENGINKRTYEGMAMRLTYGQDYKEIHSY